MQAGAAFEHDRSIRAAGSRGVGVPVGPVSTNLVIYRVFLVGAVKLAGSL
jgi:hypothetical protein